MTVVTSSVGVLSGTTTSGTDAVGCVAGTSVMSVTVSVVVAVESADASSSSPLPQAASVTVRATAASAAARRMAWGLRSIRATLPASPTPGAAVKVGAE